MRGEVLIHFDEGSEEERCFFLLVWIELEVGSYVDLKLTRKARFDEQASELDFSSRFSFSLVF